MDRAAIIDRLRAHEGELKAAGVLGVPLFGSAARGGAAEGSDVDLAVTSGGSKPSGVICPRSSAGASIWARSPSRGLACCGRSTGLGSVPPSKPRRRFEDILDKAQVTESCTMRQCTGEGDVKRYEPA